MTDHSLHGDVHRCLGKSKLSRMEMPHNIERLICVWQQATGRGVRPATMKLHGSRKGKERLRT